MQVTFVDPKEIKNLEQYVVSLVTGIISLKTLENYHITAVKEGILPEDLNCRCNTLVWDFRRMIKSYQDQIESVLDLLPEDFDILEVVEAMKKEHIKEQKD